MNTQQQVKVVQIWIVVVFVGVAVVRVSVLVLPHDGVTEQRHAPKTNIVYEGISRGCKMSSIVAECTYEPPEDSKKTGPDKTPLA